MLSNFVEFFRMLSVEFCRTSSNFSNRVECCRMSVEYCRILSNFVEFPSNFVECFESDEFYRFSIFSLNFGKYCILVQYNPIPGISSSLQFISVQFNYFPVTSIHLSIFMVWQLNSKEVIAPSHFLLPATIVARSCKIKLVISR